MKVTPTDAARTCCSSSRKVFGDDRGFFLESFHARALREARASRGRSCRTTSRARRRASCAGCTSRTPHAAGQAGAACVARRGVRRGGRHAPRLAHLRPVGRRRAVRARTSASCGCRRASRTASACSARRADFLYKCTDFYAPEDEQSVRWNDPALGIAWPVKEPRLCQGRRGAAAEGRAGAARSSLKVGFRPSRQHCAGRQGLRTVPRPKCHAVLTSPRGGGLACSLLWVGRQPAPGKPLVSTHSCPSPLRRSLPVLRLWSAIPGRGPCFVRRTARAG